MRKGNQEATAAALMQESDCFWKELFQDGKGYTEEGGGVGGRIKTPTLDLRAGRFRLARSIPMALSPSRVAFSRLISP